MVLAALLVPPTVRWASVTRLHNRNGKLPLRFQRSAQWEQTVAPPRYIAVPRQPNELRMRLLLPLLFFGLAAAGRALPQPSDPVSAPATEQPAENAAERIALQSPDQAIEKRLRGLFAQLEELNQVSVQVGNGVVTLTGTTLTAEERQKAEGIASRLAGVVEVENEIGIEHRVGARLDPMVESANELFREVVAFLPLLLLSLVIFIGFWVLGRLATRPTRFFRKIAPNPLVQTLVQQIVRLAFILLGLVVAMRILGATTLLGSVLGAAGVLGLAIGFAVRDTIENYIASVLLSVRRPFAPNDHVIIEGLEGRVTRLNSRATFLTSFDGNELRIPNAIVYKAKITNFSQIPHRRFEFDVGIGYENNLCHALATALKAVKSSDGVLSDPEPFVLTDALDASTIKLKVFGWVDQRKSDFGKVRGEAIRAVKSRFDGEKISMPAPIQNIRAIGEPANTPDQPRPSSSQVANATDTKADHNLERKVHAIRSDAGEDLLTTEAPRE